MEQSIDTENVGAVSASPEEIEKPILATINNIFEKKYVNPNEYSPLTLAFIGDSIFDIVIKSVIVEKANCQVNKLQTKTSKIVKATSQALIVEALMDDMTEEEKTIYRRGRNAKPYTKAKNASYGEYCKATGLEAMIGYLYLKGDTERLVELIKLGLDKTQMAL